MKVIITGMNGTVAPVLANYFNTKGYEIIAWNREETPIDHYESMEQFIVNSKPTLFLHIATGDPSWAKNVAEICFKHHIKFLFTSTVSVFSEQGTGPYDINSIPNATDDYGSYKILCEKLVKEANPNAYIVRLGWQIGKTTGNNNMIDYLYRQMDEKGYISASSKWYPSTSFLEDTASAIYDVVETKENGLYLINSNTNFSFYELCQNLKKYHPTFKVVEDNSLVRDDRMFDDRVVIAKLMEIF